jgi:ubiquinone/menaquinone biosynthesis C-methylase UbiE
VEPVERMTFPDAFADVVVSSAVLHFASDDAQFDAMVREMWRVLKPGACCSAGWPRLSAWKIACVI